jgi:hypothetical protein
MTSFIDKITLECLTNYRPPISTNNDSIDKKDAKFYRKRIVGLVKELLYDNIPLTKVQADFINECVYNFKSVDQADLLQKELDAILPDTTPSHNAELGSVDSSNKLLMRTKKVNMDTFVKRTNVYRPILPVKREVNLDDPQLRVKGLSIDKMTIDKIGKKMDNIYEVKEKTTKKKKKTTVYIESESFPIESSSSGPM